MNNKKRIIIIAVILVVAIAALIVAFALPKKSDDKKVNAPAQTQTVEEKNEEEQQANAEESATAEDAAKVENNDPNVITADVPAEDAQKADAGAKTEENPKVNEAEQKQEDKPQENAQEPADESAQAPQSDNIALYIVAESELSKAEEMMKPLIDEFGSKAQIAVKSSEDETMKMMSFALPDELPKLIIIPAEGQFVQIPNCTDVEAIKQELSKLK